MNLDLVDAVLDLLIDGELGVWHLSNPGLVSWTDLSRLHAEAAGHDPDRILEVSAEAI